MTDTSTRFQRSEERDGMIIDWHVPITMDDGNVLRCDVFRPLDGGRYPVVLTYGPYAKGAPFQEVYPVQWEALAEEFPEVARNSSTMYQNWEVVDPELWVPDGYICVRVDSRGAGWSEGFMDVLSPRETKDLYDCIEWSARQAWSTGRIALCGISYYAINGWFVAGLQPPHLAAIVGWEGMADYYRDAAYHGGIPCAFAEMWFAAEVQPMQYGMGTRSVRHPVTGEHAAGPVTLSDPALAGNRSEPADLFAASPLDGPFYRKRSAQWDLVEVPFLSAANWGGQGLHSRGNFEAFTQARSQQKWLEVHGLEHWTHFYSDYGVALQKRFLGHFLKGEQNGWDDEPPVLLQVRHPDGSTVERREHEWPLARTRWTRLHLDASERTLSFNAPDSSAADSFDAAAGTLTFWSAPLAEETEITGPIAAKLFISSTTSDADVFTTVRVFDPAGDEVVLRGALDPNTPFAQGWLRASHRAIDKDNSLPWRPYHPHDRIDPLEPGEVYELDVEIWPSCLVIPAGYRIAVDISSRDYEYAGDHGPFAEKLPYPTNGCGPFTHPFDARPDEVRTAHVTVHTGQETGSYLLLPIIPADSCQE
ncbi:CocE/NonD family hydrolase [Nocardia cyriacigeorgica]|uniref:Cocaine esterase n=1 Tax=Nocardia cyriacigeorgica TaxID=135487 RepID=A0A4U8W6K4_9NOCA|nr:CocE/NonD family hydrolase [Nocardia cyriacigeorgica]VFA97198.1 Cocaine esterase [Nocardia cyriacigeorgica]